MRSSILRNWGVLQSCEAVTRRRFTTLQTPHATSSICQICNKQQKGYGKRWQSSSTSSKIITNSTTPKPPQTNYEFFPKSIPKGPPPAGPFHIDPRSLRQEFLQLQAVAHPDRHPSHLKTRAEATSARINEAYKTLQNPLLRAQYLLGLRGIDISTDETLKVEDPELLMEVLDSREEIENTKEEEELVELRRVNDERIRGSEEVLDRAFRDDDMEVVKIEAVRLRYWVNIKDSLDGWEKGRPVVFVH